MKILVTGNAGSGKSTLAKKLSKNLNIPYYGLDKIVWQENWKRTPYNEKQRLIKEITRKPHWIVDGVSMCVAEEANVIYFLDISMHSCIINILRRFIRNIFKTREGLPKNCPEYIGLFKAIWIAMIFSRKVRPLILDYKGKNEFIHIKNHAELCSMPYQL